jgi:tRNA pseudouridine38-40 synthase
MRYKIVLSYDGSYFHGFQRQTKENSIQKTLEDALSSILQEKILIKGAGRTDAGVHAINQVAHFDTKIEMPLHGFREILNKWVMPHIYIKSIEKVDESFHARINVVKKEYRYFVSLNEFDPLKANYLYFFTRPLDIQKIQEALPYFLGTHDFRGFTKNQKLQNTIRTIEKSELTVKDGILSFDFIGDGFMYNMVRIMVALLLRIGEGKNTIEDLQSYFHASNRNEIPYLAPSQGLYLWQVYYKEKNQEQSQ